MLYFLVPKRVKNIDVHNVDEYFSPFLSVDTVANSIEIKDIGAYMIASLEKESAIEYEDLLQCVIANVNGLSIVKNECEFSNNTISHEKLRIFEEIPKEIVEDFLLTQKPTSIEKKFYIAPIKEENDATMECEKKEDEVENTKQIGTLLNLEQILLQEASKRDESYLLLRFLLDERREANKQRKEENKSETKEQKNSLVEKLVFFEPPKTIDKRSLFVIHQAIDQIPQNEIEYEIEILAS